MVIFDTLVRMCHLTHDEMHNDIQTMIDGRALRTYSNNASDCATYIESMEILKKLYN